MPPPDETDAHCYFCLIAMLCLKLSGYISCILLRMVCLKCRAILSVVDYIQAV